MLSRLLEDGGDDEQKATQTHSWGDDLVWRHNALNSDYEEPVEQKSCSKGEPCERRWISEFPGQSEVAGKYER